MQEGVPAENIEIAGRADKEPVMSNATAEGRAANRRVELHIIPENE
jgi:chemotaxis protein MotB